MKLYEMLYGVPETYTLIAEQFTVVWECLCVHQFHFPRSLDFLHDSPSLKPLKIFTSSCDWLTNDNDFFSRLLSFSSFT